MLPDLDEWDESVLLSLKGVDERAFVEFKASDLVNTDGAKWSKTKEEIAKQACAFSNAGGGFLVLGLNDEGDLDGGVPTQLGREDIKAWVEKVIPATTFPPIHGCEARAITTSRHAAGRCALVVQIPLSELRPHWVRESNKDVPYIRAGEHSAPMPLQTFRDLIGRSEAPRAEIVSISVERPVGKGELQPMAWVWPQVRLVAGTICRDWLLTLEILDGGAGSFDLHLLGTLPRTDFFSSEVGRVPVKGQCPLMRGAAVPLTTEPFPLRFLGRMRHVKVRATLHVPGAEECSREEGIWGSQ